jgi:Bacterial archaeo-eukaryotic release factor family 5
MTQPSLEAARELSEWRPPLGVLSVFLGFDPADRTGVWRTELRNGLDSILEVQQEAVHARRVALRATAKRLTERFEDGDLRPPPRGEVGFVEVSEKEGTEHWFGTAAPPVADACVEFGADPVVAPLLDICGHGGARGVAWRERKSQSTNNPARAQGVSSSGHDQFGERLDHNRQRFLGECGGLVARRLEGDKIDELIVFGPSKDAESFKSGFGSQATLTVGGDQDLISVPTGKVSDVVSEVVTHLDEERDRALVERALGEAKGGSRGAAGRQEVKEALGEGRVDHLVFDAAIGQEGESLIRAAMSSSARVTVVRDELAAPLQEAEGVAALLRY